MSSIRLYILDALARRGEMHGHQLRLLAEQEHVHLWTDISVGALYGALKRLATEGLLAEVRTEREGSYPERQVYGITDRGREVLGDLHRQQLEQVWFRPDPFDLALSRPDAARLDDLVDVLEDRVTTLQRLLSETDAANDRARPYLSVGRGPRPAAPRAPPPGRTPVAPGSRLGAARRHRRRAYPSAGPGPAAHRRTTRTHTEGHSP